MNCCIRCPNPWCPKEKGENLFKNNGALAIHLSLSQSCQDYVTEMQHRSNVCLNENNSNQQDNNEESNDSFQNASEILNPNINDDEIESEDTSLSSVNDSVSDNFNVMGNDQYAFDCSYVSFSDTSMSTSSGSNDLNSVTINEHPTKKRNHVFVSTIEQQSMVKLLKILEDINCPDYALPKILNWACEAYQNKFNFDPDCTT